MCNKSMKKILGFSLIELMVTVAIVAILAAVAYPSYRDQIVRSRRSDARSALNEVAAKMQQYYLDNKSYAGANGTPSVVGSNGSSSEGYYTITIASDATTFTLTATPTTKGAQNADTTCATFTLNQLGTKASKNSSNADTTAQCW